jgi:hypothetical protein
VNDILLSEFLGRHELRQLSGCAWSSTQAAWLRSKGIPFQQDGKRLIVCRVHVRAWADGTLAVSSNGPDWSKVA